MTTSGAPRVLLVAPIPTDRVGGLRHDYYPVPLGLASIAAFLARDGIDVRVFDGLLTPSVEALRALVRSFRPRFVGVTSYTHNIDAAHRIATVVKGIDGGILTVVGGVHATSLPVATLREFGNFDIAVVGEGEAPLRDLVRCDGAPAGLPSIEGIAFRVDGEILLTPPRRDTIDLNELPPPAWSLFDLSRYRGLAFGHRTKVGGDREFTVELTRGCPGRCKFCSHSIRYDQRNRKAVPRVLQEIEGLIERFGAQRLVFYSDTFTLDRAYVQSLCEGLIAGGLATRVSWACWTRVDRIDPELARLMKAAGCNSISLGFESGSPRILRSVHKEYDLDSAIRNLEGIRRAGIWVMSNFMIGFPDETRADVMQTIRLALRLNLDAASFGVLIPFPGAEITRELNAPGERRITSTDWKRYDSHSGAGLIRRKHLSTRELLFFVHWANARFWLRPGRLPALFRYLDASSIAGHGIRLVRELLGRR